MLTQSIAVVMGRAMRKLHLRFTVLLLVLLSGVGGGANAKPSAQRVDIFPPQVPTSCPRIERTVTNKEQLITALANAGPIVIPSGVTIDLGETRGLEVGSCVTIKGTRGGLDPGALIVATNRDRAGSLFEVVGQYVRIEGLRFRGPVTTDDRSAMDHSVHAIGISGNASSVQIDNNTFEFWSVGVTVFRGWPAPWPETGTGCQEKAPLISITRNYFNRNAIEDLGYGVGVFRGCAKIEGNLFNKNRHAVAASGDTAYENGTFGKGYIARYNYVLEGGFRECDPGCYWNQHFDVHGTGSGGYGGTAGEYFVVAWNTIRGEQQSGVWPFLSTRPAFMLRGRAEHVAVFHDNVVVHDDAGEAVRLKVGSSTECTVGGTSWPSYELCHLVVGPNRYNTYTETQLAVGDFDGDGRDDVFLANGTAWWYSSAGRTEWRFLLPSTHRVNDLRFGHFNRDARTDVLFSVGETWWVSMGGTRLPRLLRTDGRPLADCVFGHFDDDGITDVLWANGSRWFVSSGGTGPWTELRTSPIRAANMRVGDFTADGIDDIFWIENDRWHLWHPTVNLVSEDVTKPVRDSDMALIVVADFDNDGRADLAKTQGDGWNWLRTGSNVWESLRNAGGQPEYRDLRAALLGRFTWTRRVGAIRYASSQFAMQFRYGLVIWNGAQDAFVPWTPGGQEMR
jgi:hypothetical protein